MEMATATVAREVIEQAVEQARASYRRQLKNVKKDEKRLAAVERELERVEAASNRRAEEVGKEARTRGAGPADGELMNLGGRIQELRREKNVIETRNRLARGRLAAAEAQAEIKFTADDYTDLEALVRVAPKVNAIARQLRLGPLVRECARLGVTFEEGS